MPNRPIEPKKITFKELANLLERRVFAIPEIQREFVWTKIKITDFLDSIRKHYPVGSFLICKVPSSKIKHIRESTVLPPFDSHSNKECYIVVDGQQRLSVIYSIMNGKNIKETRRYRDGINFGDICLSKNENREYQFTFYKDEDGKNIKLYDVLNKRLKYNVNKQKKNAIKACEQAFENYNFPFIFISGYNEENMREAFVRLNKGGTTLSSEDKIFALAYHKDTDFRRHCAQVLHSLKRGFDSFDRIHFIKAIMANLGVKDFVSSGSQTRFAKKVKNSRQEMHLIYKKEHKKIFESIKRSADFFVQRFEYASYLPYPAMLTILSTFYHNNNNKEPTVNQIKQLERWFWVTGFAKRYSGGDQARNQMSDAIEMKKLAESKKYRLNLEGKARIKPLSIKELSRIRYNKFGAVRNTFFCYLIEKMPLKFSNGQRIRIADMSAILGAKNDHHVFPKDILKDYFYKEYINSIFNICFLTFEENIKMKNKPPWTYLKDFKKSRNFKRVLESHVLPQDESLLKKGEVGQKYESFIRSRGKLIKDDLISFMGEKFVED